MEKAERKEMFKIVAETFKNLGFEVSKNKRVYVIEYPEVYVRIGIDAYRGFLNYCIQFYLRRYIIHVTILMKEIMIYLISILQ